MANLQIKGMADDLYRQLKDLAAEENRSVSQQVLFLIRRSLAQRRSRRKYDSAAEVLLSLAGAWEDTRTEDEIIADIRRARRSSTKLSEGL